jgi:hypothetical protein
VRTSKVLESTLYLFIEISDSLPTGKVFRESLLVSLERVIRPFLSRGIVGDILWDLAQRILGTEPSRLNFLELGQPFTQCFGLRYQPRNAAPILVN